MFLSGSHTKKTLLLLACVVLAALYTLSLASTNGGQDEEAARLRV